MSTNTLPPYIEKLLAAERAGKVPRGVLSHAIIEHDGWCRLMAGTGQCNCNPALKIVATEPGCVRDGN